MINLQQQLIALVVALLCAVVGSIHDLHDRRIPNWITGPAILTGLLMHSLMDHWSGFGYSALAGLIAGAVALVFWLAGGMGAGDVKLMAAIGCIAGWPSLHLLLFFIGLAGAVFGVALSAYHGRLRQTLSNVFAVLQHHGINGLKPHPELNLDNPGTLRLPFALPVAAGCLATLCCLLLGVRL